MTVLNADPKYWHPTYDDDGIPTIIWDRINNKKWDCGYKFHITPLITGSFQVVRILKTSSFDSITSDMGVFKSLKEAKQAIADWKLAQYVNWEFKQKNPVIVID